jgi:hypothetical protein
MKKLITSVLLSVAVVFSVCAQVPKFITVKGKEIIGVDNKPFLMRGTNLGNWLVPEGYMFKFKSVNSQRLINEALTELVGPEEMKLVLAQVSGYLCYRGGYPIPESIRHELYSHPIQLQIVYLRRLHGPEQPQPWLRIVG